MFNCAILGATGYTGVELIKILLRHPRIRIVALTTRQKEVIPVRRLAPTLPAGFDLEIRPHAFSELRRKADLVFLCLPHTEAMETAKKFLEAGKMVIDLSADFRLRQVKMYEKWYDTRHKAPRLLKQAVYGLPEIYRHEIQRAELVANPGCYATGAILGIYPLLRGKLVNPDSMIIDAKSGVSGAGRKLNPDTQFCEMDENFYAYKIGRHPHTPEIEQVLSEAAETPVSVTFVPHLLPVERGILSTIYLRKRGGAKAEAIAKAFQTAYQKEPFVRLRPEGTFPALRDVRRTNFCDIGFQVDPDSGGVIIITAIDNLLKGASGQAVQNMNIRCGFAEEEGLKEW